MIFTLTGCWNSKRKAKRDEIKPQEIITTPSPTPVVTPSPIPNTPSPTPVVTPTNNTRKTFQEVTYSELKNIVNKNEKSVIFIGRDDCSHCINYKPIILEVAIQNKFTINYINTNSITSRDDLSELLTFFDTNATPTTVIVSNGRILGKHIGEMNRSELVEFLNNYYY